MTEPTNSPQDWAATAAQRIDSGVAMVRAKTVDPLFRLPRIIGFGLVAIAIVTFIGVLLYNTVVRVLTDYLFGQHVWITYLVLGGIFLLVGALLWSRTRR